MLIYVKTRTGKTITLQIDPSDEIIVLKHRLEEMLNEPVDQQRLIFAGMQLLDERTLASYRIQE